MAETRKRGRDEEDGVVLLSDVQGLLRSEATTEGSGDLGEDIMDLLSTEEDTVSELMSLLLDTTAENKETPTRVKFIDNPYSSPLIFQASSSYVTINGNEESCGSSFSDLESSFMASVDMGGISNVAREGVATGCGWELGVAAAWDDSDWYLTGIEEIDGCDGSDLDDYVLAKFLGEEESLF